MGSRDCGAPPMYRASCLGTADAQDKCGGGKLGAKLCFLEEKRCNALHPTSTSSDVKLLTQLRLSTSCC